MPRKKTRIRKKKSIPEKFGSSEDPYLLDRFSEQNLSSWNRNSSLLTEFRVKQFYYLEGLRAIQKRDILKSLEETQAASLPLSNWVRIVDYQHSLKPLHATGSMNQGGRFNIGNDLDPSRFPAFPALYIAEHYQTAYAEKFGGNPGEGALPAHELALRSSSSFTSVRLEGKIGNLLDLRTPDSLIEFSNIIGRFKLSKELRDMAARIGQRGPNLISDHVLLLESLLDPNWRGSPALWDLPSNSQIFAQLTKEAGFEGIIFKSTKGRSLCISLFLNQLEGSSSYVCLADDPPNAEVLTSTT